MASCSSLALQKRFQYPVVESRVASRLILILDHDVTMGCLQATHWPLDISTFQVTTKSCGLDARSILFFDLLDQSRPTVLWSYLLIDHGIIGRLQPRFLLIIFKIMYFGWLGFLAKGPFF